MSVWPLQFATCLACGLTVAALDGLYGSAQRIDFGFCNLCQTFTSWVWRESDRDPAKAGLVWRQWHWGLPEWKRVRRPRPKVRLPAERSDATAAVVKPTGNVDKVGCAHCGSDRFAPFLDGDIICATCGAVYYRTPPLPADTAPRKPRTGKTGGQRLVGGRAP